MEEEMRILYLIPNAGPAETRVKKNVSDQTLLSFEVPGAGHREFLKERRTE
jgi:hypothetical protein